MLQQNKLKSLAAAMTLGAQDAPHTIELILDPLCPHCRSAWQEIAETLGPARGRRFAANSPAPAL